MIAPTFQTEAELCAAFIAAAETKGEWTAYPETSDWDILLVRKSDGFQIGVEAKLRLNALVITQALEDFYPRDEGPDCRAVLVPDKNVSGGPFETICAYIGLTIIRMRSKEEAWNPQFYPYLPRDDRYGASNREWHECLPTRRHKLPDYVPDVAAGCSAPIKLTKWKIGAIKIAVTLELRGFVTRHDFKAAGIDHRRWLPGQTGWLQIGDGGYVRGPHWPDLKAQHPTNYEQIKADAAKWMPAETRMAIQTPLDLRGAA